MCTSLQFNFCMHYSVLTTESLVSTHHYRLTPCTCYPPSPSSFLGGNYQSFLFIYVFVSVLFIILFPAAHVWVRS